MQNTSTINKFNIFSTQVGLSQWHLTKTIATLVSVQREASGAASTLVVQKSFRTHLDGGILSIGYCAGNKRVEFLMDMWSDKTLKFLSAAADGMTVLFFTGAGQLELVDQGQHRGTWKAGKEAVMELRKTHPRRPASAYVKAAFEPDMIADYAIHPNQPNRHANGLPGAMSVTVLVDEAHFPGLAQAA